MRPPAAEELAGLIESYVRDEVYYREALAMGLDRNDPIVRQRMRMKLEFLLEDLTAETAPSDATLNAYLQEHPDRFQLDPKISFRQLYLNPDRHPDLAGAAEQILHRLHNGATLESVGEPTLLGDSYTLATTTEIARLFGRDFAQALVGLAPGDWTGPIYSGLGAHLVAISERRAARLPALAEVRAQLEREYLAQHARAQKDEAYQALRAGYEVLIETPIPAGTDPAKQ
jgi:hypothetical protein